jgi:ribosomal protein L29
MAIIKNKEIEKLSEKEITGKLKDLKLELVKSGLPNSKSKLRPKEIKKAIARILTFNRLNKKESIEQK